jgi:hypothetical protein
MYLLRNPTSQRGVARQYLGQEERVDLKQDENEVWKEWLFLRQEEDGTCSLR